MDHAVRRRTFQNTFLSQVLLAVFVVPLLYSFQPTRLLYGIPFQLY